MIPVRQKLCQRILYDTYEQKNASLSQAGILTLLYYSFLLATTIIFWVS